MRPKILHSALALILLATALSSAADKNEEKRDKTRKMAAQTLQDLHKLQPTAQAAIQKAAGYGVFNNMGTNLLLLSTARGAGIAVNSKSKQETLLRKSLASPRVRLESGSDLAFSTDTPVS